MLTIPSSNTPETLDPSPFGNYTGKVDVTFPHEVGHADATLETLPAPSCSLQLVKTIQHSLILHITLTRLPFAIANHTRPLTPLQSKCRPNPNPPQSK